MTFCFAGTSIFFGFGLPNFAIVLKGMRKLAFRYLKRQTLTIFMRYAELSDVYEELEKNSSKLKKAEIIAKMLKASPAKLLPKLVLLLTGRVFPQWSPYEIGIANQMVIRSIAKATGISEEKVSDKFKKVGDLGLTVESLVEGKKQATLKSKALDTEDVFSNLQKLAELTGEGSQERKVGLI